MAAGRSSWWNFGGAILLMAALPPLTWYMWVCATAFHGALVAPASKAEVLDLLRRVPAPTFAAVAFYGAWLLLQVVLQIAAPGKVLEGTPLADGSRLKYKMNGWFSFWFTLAALTLLAGLGVISPSLAYDQFGPLLVTANIFAFLFSLFLYWPGRGSIYDYFLGVSLNPRIGPFDLKYFCESRPGLILWVVMDLSLAAKQYQLHGRLSTPMILVVCFQLLYVADYFFHEEAILTTWDIKYERFGWMLCWGDLVWVPFTYCLQALYLVDHTHELTAPAAVAIVALNMLGYFLFRAANIQKHRFRTNPSGLVWGRRPEYIRTEQGALLLTSGWWGVARHLNYLGDLMMGLAWCLPALFEHPLPYFYFVYFLILLVHRERRDHQMCQKKYGKDWEAYCARVRWRIIPGVY